MLRPDLANASYRQGVVVVDLLLIVFILDNHAVTPREISWSEVP